MLQIYTRDMVPELMQAQTEQTARTLGEAGQNLGRAFEKMADEHKRTSQQAKAVDAFFGAMTDEERAKAGVGDLTAFKNLSAKDRIAKGTGLLQRQQYQQGQQQMDLNGAHLRDFEDRRRAREAGVKVAPEILRGLSEQQSAGQDPLAALSGRGPMNEVSFDASMAGSGQLPSLSPASLAVLRGHAAAGAPLDDGVLATILREIHGESPAGPMSFEEDPATGARFARTGKSVLPSGINPSRQSNEAEELFDAENNVIGHRVPIGGGKFTFRAVKPSASGKLMEVLDPVTGKPLKGFGMDATGKVHDFRGDIQKRTAGSFLDKEQDAPAAPSGAKLRYNPATKKLEPVK